MLSPQTPSEDRISQDLLDDDMGGEKLATSTSINDFENSNSNLKQKVKPSKKARGGIFHSIFKCWKCIYPDVSHKENVEMSPLEKFIKKVCENQCQFFFSFFVLISFKFSFLASISFQICF